MNMLELKPCPFCGNINSPVIKKTEHLEHYEQSLFSGGYVIICDASSWNNKLGCGASTGWNGTLENAVENWNRRA